MNNQDLFDREVAAGNFKAAAELAISFGEGKASKSGQWAWARDAVAAAARAGVTLNPGSYSAPDFDAMRAQLSATVPQTVIVTRHSGLVAWLAERGIEGPIVAQATAADVRGREVIGVLPLALAAECASITTVDMPGLALAQRGQDLTPAEMDAAGATLTKYIVRRA